MLKLLISDFVQAKLLSKNKKVTFFKIVFLIFKSSTAKIALSVRLRSSNLILLSYLAKKYLSFYFIEIGKNVVIGNCFFMPHPRCIIIADNTVIGNNVHVGQYVTIGGSFKRERIIDNEIVQKLPIIGSRVMIMPGAVIGGPCTIGDDVIIGANAVVTKDVPSNKIITGQNEISVKNISVIKEGGQFKVK